MTDIKETQPVRGVIVEFDFAVLNGAEILFETAKKLMAEGEIPFDEKAEAHFLAGGNYLGALTGYYSHVKTKKTPQKAAKDLSERFVKALNAAVPGAVNDGFKKFVATLAGKGVKVVISTRATLSAVKDAFAGVIGENVELYQESSQTYGALKWDAWRRAAARCHLRHTATEVVTGSGLGVKSALLAGMGAVAVINRHVAYQDFSGADDAADKVDEKLAKRVIQILKA
ncbi:MAG: hypothetical protein J6W80_00470 [Kiritimatiellae bacterium]|nr:hypothetical protein [Kiritimatiellia bacterium]